MTRTILFLILYFSAQFASAQQLQPGLLSFDEFLGYVKKFHPVVRQADLRVSSAQAELMAARGAFDPKIAVDYDKKEFKDTEYYSILNSSFKIPTWYGIELKAGFDNSEGMYVNPQNTTPGSGLTSLGISIPLAQGLLINKRMADLRMAKIQLQLSDAERKIQATEAIYEASKAYFNWKKAYDQVSLYQTYRDFAQTRYSGIVKLTQAGDKPAIDSIEAGITVKNRRLDLADAELKLAKAKLDLANFLWIDNIPVELGDGIVPEVDLDTSVAESLNLNELLSASLSTENHPKIISLQSKLNLLDVERRFKSNLLLPRVDISYNYLSEPSYFDNYRFEDYKIGLNFSYPIFLRKERGELKIAKIKLQDAQLDLDLMRVELNNAIAGQQVEIRSITGQKELVDDVVESQNIMLTSEERLFLFGESSIFLVNSRENSVINAKLSQIDIRNRLLVAHADLFKLLSNPE